ncbi:DUF885 domain-containing protein [Simiduia curdlanivorans]|uniref:DUF885 domain-containing protein n=1 Tax=Simiduia curdlanivorans TaxID=1492769 RepID=A0ABV8V7Q2_9GAMM|nr:DUF885 domain-containing protein [Simiduia curdlanivorans]MDN3640715.1 DUF885 domain-containing protein [Simiduia curdlanivorans]
MRPSLPKQLLIALFSLLLLAGCDKAPTAAQPAPSANPGAELQQIFHAYQEANFELNPLAATYQSDPRYNHILGDYLSNDYLKRSEALEARTLSALEQLDRAQLSEQDQLSYDIFSYDRKLALNDYQRGFAKLATYLPISQFYSFHSTVAKLGSGASAQPFNTPADYDIWLQRVAGFTAWVDTAIARMREGMEKGVVQPRIVVERMIPQLAAMLVETPQESLFYKPITNLPAEFSAEDKARLTKAYETAIAEQITPAYRKLHDFVAGDYLAGARATVGLGQVPGGQAWYQARAKYHTTTDLSTDQIHQLGVAEVARIRAEMEAVMQTLKFQGSLKDFFHFLKTDPQFQPTSETEILAAYEALRVKIDAALPKLFDIAPKAPYVIKPIEAFRAASQAAAEYNSPAPDGSRPGIFYVNTYDLPARPTYMREMLSIHEAAPGHHFQIALAQEQTQLPDFRRFDGPNAYVEGWGLYTESLGKDLGLYTDPYQYFGALTADMWRACRLVVDTGMHAQGWSREQAIAFMQDNLALSDTDIVAEVERYIAYHGQALSYKIGQLKLLELRARAQEKLGDRFDIKAFHRQILIDGAMPLAILEAKIDRWIAQQLATR